MQRSSVSITVTQRGELLFFFLFQFVYEISILASRFSYFLFGQYCRCEWVTRATRASTRSLPGDGEKKRREKKKKGCNGREARPETRWVILLDEFFKLRSRLCARHSSTEKSYLNIHSNIRNFEKAFTVKDTSCERNFSLVG